MQRIDHFELNGPHAGPFRLGAGSSLRVGSGRLWLTVAGDSEDIWLGAGARWDSPAACRLWMSAEPEAVFQVLRPARRAHGRPFAVWRHVWTARGGRSIYAPASNVLTSLVNASPASP